MRKIMMATAALLIVGTAPSMARDYAWCAQTRSNGGNPQCDFDTYRQCQATVSGQGGECIQNPRLAFDRAGWRNDRGGRRNSSEPQWDNRW
jgi:hypothetical protein